MRETIKTWKIDTEKYRDVRIRFEIIADGSMVLHELNEEFFVGEPMEVMLILRRLDKE